MNILAWLTNDSETGTDVRLTITNQEDDTIWLARPRLGMNKMEGNFFQFESANAIYLGRQVKRTEYDESELVRLEREQSFGVLIELDSIYRIDPQDQTFRVRYSATHPLTSKNQPSDFVISNWTEITKN